MDSYSVESEYTDGSGDTQQFDRKHDALKFAVEESKWGGTFTVAVLDPKGNTIWHAYGDQISQEDIDASQRRWVRHQAS